ncbi:uncharacterized protein LOC120629570 [Pararge aegeria]|uniref:Jg4030 protein n=1 Tax=Pararge aegeria aegeria TaxID=348720 RepID=A0A8S4R610_9NEOP|nr:uncharacterized protein LOC120629570 [Pararge aegeria]CAH2231969.1 jg4030 [Pararge aegeria aegeria]
MDKCFVVCGCDDLEGVTKSDLDRFTDKIENVLNDEKGRRLFRNYMFTSKMKNGRRALDLYENIERLLNSTEDAESASFRNYLRDYDRLIDAAERIEELDFATMERMVIARDSENKEEIVEVLKVLKLEVTKALRREYSAFRLSFVPSKHN